MTIYRSYTPAEIKSLADDLRLQLSEGILPGESRKIFVFRGPEGNTWTMIPETGEWVVFSAGSWQPAEPPDQPLDGSIEILDLVALPLSPLENDPPSEDQPVQGDANIREMIEQATHRVRDSYRSGRINSAEAENLLMDLYLLDPAGLIWSYGIHSDGWYFFRTEAWESAGSGGPDPKDFEIKPPDTSLVCSSCGIPLNGGKFCSECGAPTPDPEPAYSQAAKEVVERFSEANPDPLPEPIVPAWEPAPGFPEVENADGSPPAEQLPSTQQGEWRLRISEGEGAGETFPLGERTRLGRRKTNQIVLKDGKCSLLHAEIQQQNDGYVITDQESTNGTMVNGVRIESPTKLHPGDILSIGDTRLVVEEGELNQEAVMIKRTPGAVSKQETHQPESSDSPPRKRSRNVLVVFVLVFAVTCLCCLSVGLGGYFLVDNQGAMGAIDRWKIGDGTFTDSRDDDTTITSQTAKPAHTELPLEITDSYGHFMVSVPRSQFEMDGEAEVGFGEFQMQVDPEY